MSSARKTIELLSIFSAQHPELGLSQICRMAQRDKATTHRHLQDLEQNGLVEQNPMTKMYRLGPAILQIAQMRERTVPRKATAQDALRSLANITGETAHVSVLSGSMLYTLSCFESPKHSTRAVVDLKTLPLHATASGLCAVAFGPDTLLDVACETMTPFTQNTPVDRDALEQAATVARRTGFARANRSLENEIYSISTPIYDQTGLFAGAVSVASVATRFTGQSDALITEQLKKTSRAISCNWGGCVPDRIENCWAETLLHTDELEAMP